MGVVSMDSCIEGIINQFTLQLQYRILGSLAFVWNNSYFRIKLML